MPSTRIPRGIAHVAELARPDQLLDRRVTQSLDMQERTHKALLFSLSHPVSHSTLQEEEKSLLLALELEPFALPNHEHSKFISQMSFQAREHGVIGAGVATSGLAPQRISA